MDRFTNLKRKLEKREMVYGFLTALRDKGAISAFARDGIDFVLYDLEHGSSNAEQIHELLAACRTQDVPTIVRVQDAVYHLIAKLIDMGADGILLPRTETMEQVETAIGAIRFAPIGRKGCGGSHQFKPKETFDEFQQNRLLFLQIESPLGVSNLPEIMAKHGDQVAGVIIGPYDMSVQAGTPLDIESPVVIEQIYKTIEICQGLAKSVGIFCGNLATAKRWYEAGMNILWVSSEMSLLQQGITCALNELESMSRPE